MGFIDRLGDILKSYLNDDNTELPFGSSRGSYSGDPDLKAAFDELNDFLNNKSPGSSGRSGGGFSGASGASQAGGARTAPKPAIPEELRADFVELEVPFGASMDDCKAAHKRLLKIHHPDRHAGHADNMKKATEKSTRINNSYQRICRWRETGRV